MGEVGGEGGKLGPAGQAEGGAVGAIHTEVHVTAVRLLYFAFLLSWSHQRTVAVSMYPL